MARKEYAPKYLVEFWKTGQSLKEVWRITDAIDVLQVVNWAIGQDLGDTFSVYTEDVTGDRPVMLRVFDGMYRTRSRSLGPTSAG